LGAEKQKAEKEWSVETHLSFFIGDRLNGAIIPDRSTEQNRVFRWNFQQHWLHGTSLAPFSLFLITAARRLIPHQPCCVIQTISL